MSYPILFPLRAPPLAGPPCCFLLLVLDEQLQELQAALLASILDMDEYRRGYRSSGSGPASPLEWSDGLLLLHTCPPPLDRHLLGLLGRPKVSPPPPARLSPASLSTRCCQRLVPFLALEST